MPALDNISASVPGCTNIRQISLRDTIQQASSIIEVKCRSHSLSIGSAASPIQMGYAGSLQTVMTNGIVKKIEYERPAHLYTITIYDQLVLASDYFVVSDDGSDITVSNETAEALVGRLLTMSGVTGSYSSDTSGFTFGLPDPIKIEPTRAWQYIEYINRVTGFTTYALPNGNIVFSSRKPYIGGGDTPSVNYGVGNSGTLLRVRNSESEEGLRNKVIVIGADPIRAVASASSPYLPANYYKKMIISHPLISNQSIADAAAALNLTTFNRLTRQVHIESLGTQPARSRAIVSVEDPASSLSSSDYWVVMGSNWTVDQGGYSVALDLTR